MPRHRFHVGLGSTGQKYNGAFRGDQVQQGDAAAPVEAVNVDIADGVVRNKPDAPFKEAKQAVDLTQAEMSKESSAWIRTRNSIGRSR